MHTTRHFRKRSHYVLPLLVLFALLWTSCTSASNPPPNNTRGVTATATATPTPRPFPNAAQIDAYLQGLVRKGALNGSVLVAQHGMVFAQGYGLADRAQHIDDTVQTMYRIGSVTKQFTAMAILILQDQGKLHVADHVCLYVPNCPQGWQSITLKNLLTHSSGIPDYTGFSDFVSTWTQPTTTEELIARFKDQPLLFTPGSIFRYSNSNYVLLGYIIERLSGQSYASFLQQHIFGPLGMKHSGYDTTHPPLPLHATGYYGDYSRPDAYDMSVVYAAGALYSSVEDLYIWDQALTTTRLVSQQDLNDMFALHIPCPSSGPGGCLATTDQGYGYGWFIGKGPQGKLIYHVGRIDGFLSYNGFYPQSDIDVVVLSNFEGTNVTGIGEKLAALV